LLPALHRSKGVIAMRAIPLLLGAAAVTGCMTQPSPETRTAEGQAELQRLTAGKVAGAPVTCLPPRISPRNMVVIDDRTVAFEDSRNRAYVNHLRGECSNLRSGFYTLVVRSGGAGTCSGDIADVTDIRTGTTAGTCALGDFVPFTRG
jgi:hypothetical protein